MTTQHIQQHTAQHWHSAPGSAACWAPHSAMRYGIGIGLPHQKPRRCTHLPPKLLRGGKEPAGTAL